MKKFQIKIWVPALIILFSAVGCSRLIDALWNPDTAEFNIYVATDAGAGKLRVNFAKDDHLSQIRSTTSQGKGKYFWGYYIYRNSSSPYDDYVLRGIEKQEVLSVVADPDKIHASYKEMPSGNADNTGGPDYQDSCSSGTKYYYRAVVVYREFDGETWTTTLEDKSSSSWAAATCP